VISARQRAAALLGSALWMGIGSAGEVSLARDVQPILDRHCVACHLVESQQGGLLLEAGETHRATVGVPSSEAPLPRVAPGDPERSYLIQKLRGTHLKVGGSGAPMPFNADTGGNGLAKDERELIEAWVRAGAADN
jgi:hypothetical protein